MLISSFMLERISTCCACLQTIPMNLINDHINLQFTYLQISKIRLYLIMIIFVIYIITNFKTFDTIRYNEFYKILILTKFLNIFFALQISICSDIFLTDKTITWAIQSAEINQILKHNFKFTLNMTKLLS